ncbi:MAG: signal peptidase II [Planktomarina sp.]|jgi:signal peptidase II|uniref:signal peptidase II n=1 Tax=Planktomarina temperata TaxID=1284658 RepID=UPI001D6B4111|nr:signal peptidase II [Planktomarina temperata]MBT6522334.1 signal peptidase II [Paracoccaceae bacterium]MBT7222901.1 signal peptidase II [Marinovum sp.]MCH1469013.1 signal peptidase II [Planktomarina sp.]MDB2455135.1 signal peptidase II [Planktomarina temperata]
MQKLLLISTASILTLDQITKYLVVFYMNLIERGQMSVWPGFIHFHMAWNSGINFGLFSNNGLAARWILIVIALGICGVVTYWMRRETRSIALISAGMVIGGALGNVVDRILHGSVADFLNITCCGLHNPFAFNVADIAIFAGLLGLMLFASDAKKPNLPS